MLASSTEESEVRDPWVTRMVNLPAIMVSTTLEEPLDWRKPRLLASRGGVAAQRECRCPVRVEADDVCAANRQR
jgi:hypothetical protein